MISTIDENEGGEGDKEGIDGEKKLRTIRSTIDEVTIEKEVVGR